MRAQEGHRAVHAGPARHLGHLHRRFAQRELGLLFLAGDLSASAQVNNSKGKTKCTKSDIEKLRWIEGSWRGTDADGGLTFYENYHFVGNENQVLCAGFDFNKD